MMIYWENIKNEELQINTDTIMCLDIETSSYWIDKKSGKIIQWSKDLPDSYYNEDCNKGGCVYIWMFGIEDKIYYGREWNDFPKFLSYIKRNLLVAKDTYYIYIHNFAYEWQWIQNFGWCWNNVFARMIRKPMKATFDCFEFRCSYMLTHLSLDSWGKQNGLPKAVGDLDYTIIRSPLTELTDQEMHYCERDIEVMYVGLSKYREKYKHIKKIPLTQTGEVRKIYKGLYKHQPNYNRKITKLMPKNVDEHLIAHKIFGGGDTHANSLNANRTIEASPDNKIGSMDIVSSYPWSMVTGGFPWSRFIKCHKTEKYDFNRFCYIFFIKLTEVKNKGFLTYLARSRCISCKNGKYDNGRIAEAEEVYLYCTEEEYKRIPEWYQCNIKVINARKAIKGHLDKKYIDFILTLYGDKTQLKGVEGYEDLYMQQKQYLNSLFGCMVTDYIMPQICFDNEKGWYASMEAVENIQAQLDDIQKKFYKNYLSYYWGCWCTAISRGRLWDMLRKLPEEDILYYDTDSIKFSHYEQNIQLFMEENEKIKEINNKAMELYGYDVNRIKPLNPKGKECTLGLWDYDGEYKAFKTLGAKKYLYEDYEGELHLTVSGVPKRGVKCLKSFDDFKEGFIFDNDTCRKGLTTYLEYEDRNPIVTLPDGYLVDQPFAINLRNIGYTLGITAEYHNYIEGLQEWGWI